MAQTLCDLEWVIEWEMDGQSEEVCEADSVSSGEGIHFLGTSFIPLKTSKTSPAFVRLGMKGRLPLTFPSLQRLSST
jgi:hypothetical protein